jgi:ParB family chromosome partitioning protein
MVTKKPKGLGRGLEALLGADMSAIATLGQPDAANAQPTALHVGKLRPGKYQPRTRMDEGALNELADSIRAQGVMQPILVRPASNEQGLYEIIAGERRFRAAQIAGLTEVPVLVRDVPDEHAAAMALIENIQREDLNPIETAVAFDRLARELLLSPDQIGQRTGKDRTTIVNLLRLLQLPADLQQLVSERRLSAGHARCLCSLPNVELQREVAEKAVAQGWSVRQTERTTQRMLEGRKPKHVDEVDTDPNVKAAIHELERVLGTKVRIVEKAKLKGRIEIDYYSPEDLDRIYTVIVSPPA